MSEHVRHQDDVGAYLLGALNDLERQAFERHLRGCAECQEELERACARPPTRCRARCSSSSRRPG